MAEGENHGGPRGAPPEKDLPDAYRELLQGLFYANQVFDEKDDAGREGIIIACHAVARFIAVTHQNPLLVAPFLALRSALLDVEKGISNPILDPRVEIGKQSRSSIKKQISVVAAACLEALVADGDPLKEAASRVARHVLRWRGIGDQRVTFKTIMNWREHYRALPEDERKPFDLMRTDLSTRPDRRAQVEKLLRDGPPGIPKT
jgi:hypothetical protein